MFIKILGGLLVIASAGSLGIAFANRYSRRPKELRILRSLLQLLETEILYGATPLPIAFKNIASKAENIWHRFFLNISDNLAGGSYYTVSSAWNNAVEANLLESSLIRMDIALIKGFGNVLGSSDKTDQQKHFKLFYTQLEQQELLAEEERKKTEKMYRSLGFLIGTAIFIILI